MMDSTSATDRNRILGFLASVDRRLRLNDALGRLTRGLWVLSILLVLSRLTGIWDRPVPRAGLFLIYGFALAGVLLWSFLRRRGLTLPAGVADTRADSKDALKSSLDFMERPERTRWMDLQIQRAAALAEGLSAAEIAPTVPPRTLYAAGLLALALSALLSWNPPWLAGMDPGSWIATLDPLGTSQVSEESEQKGPLPEEQDLKDTEEALRELRHAELDMKEAFQDLESAKEALAASRLEMEQLGEDLEKLGTELDSTASLAELADAMKNQDAQKAAELLRALAEKMKSSPTSEELQALLESLKDANVQQADLAELLKRLEEGQAAMSDEALAEMAQALEDAANQLESMGEQMAALQELENMGEEMQSLQAGMGQQQASSQPQAGQQQQQSGGQASQSAGMTSSQLSMAQFQGDPSSAVPVEGGPAGDATGPGGGEEPVMGEPTTLDVQLEMELLKTPEREEPVQEEIFERLSRQEKSSLNYEALTQRGSYADDSALGHESLPWQYRSLVKQYFLSIVSKSEAKSEGKSGSGSSR
jgi:hypothetical protein